MLESPPRVIELLDPWPRGGGVAWLPMGRFAIVLGGRLWLTEPMARPDGSTG